MSDLARRLRSAREARGVTLDEVERATKIRRRFLEAIDAGDFARLPDGPPARGFIKIYARYLNLDVEQALSDFEAEVGVPVTQLNEVVPPPPERQPIVSRYTQTVKLPQVRWKGDLPPESQTELDLMADELDDSDEVGKSVSSNALILRRSEMIARQNPRPGALQSSFSLRPIKTRRDAAPPTGALRSAGSPSFGASGVSAKRVLTAVGAAVGGLALLVVVVLVIAPAFQARPIGQPSAGVTTPIAVTILAPQATGPAGQEIQVTAVPPIDDRPAPVVQPLPGGGVEMVLDARERAWVRVIVDGNVVYEGIPPLGPNIRWRGTNSVGFETGNAGAFEVIINGVRLGPAGERNQVATRAWNSAGQEIK
ncbi:MAG: helix-turn-helix domain-containing protein [Anaerolineae bacterium]|nr:helix-turn-helix domain-containing protein [Thermoflexales bacterium]MDW8407629.1 helix-turn-helix domain-containing protein [Anaerolineae bacterium]